MTELKVLMASWPDEDGLVAEIWRGDSCLGDIRWRQSQLFVNLCRSDGRSDDIELDELLDAFARARARLQEPPLDS